MMREIHDHSHACYPFADRLSQGYTTISLWFQPRKLHRIATIILRSVTLLRRLLRSGVASCPQVYTGSGNGTQKATEQSFTRTNNCSVIAFPKSRVRFGRRKQQHISLQWPIARSARPSFISLVTVNGPAMPSQPSFPKFSGGTKCGM